MRWLLASIDYPDRDDDAVGVIDRLVVGPPAEVYEAGERAQRPRRDRPTRDRRCSAFPADRARPLGGARSVREQGGEPMSVGPGWT